MGANRQGVAIISREYTQQESDLSTGLREPPSSGRVEWVVDRCALSRAGTIGLVLASPSLQIRNGLRNSLYLRTFVC